MYLNLEEKIKKLELENENLRRDVEDLKDEKEVLKDAIDNEANEKYLLKLMVDGSKINENPANLSYDNYFYFTLYFNMLFPQWKEVSRKFIHEKVGECFYSFNVQKLLPNFPSQYSVQSLRNFSFDFLILLDMKVLVPISTIVIIKNGTNVLKSLNSILLAPVKA